MHTTNSFAGTTVALRESFAGNLSFELTGGSFRTASNSQNACSLSTSSSNPLTTLPFAAKIKRAYLYWAGSSSNSTFVDSTVTFNGQTITANRTYTDSSGTSYYYGASADVTNLVKNTRNSTYSMSNLSIFANNSRCNTQTVLGGWSLLVIYEDESEDFSVINIYEGFQYFQQSAAVSSLTLVPSNFKLPANPKGQHAHITWEGDDTIGNDGEGLTFQGFDLFDSSGGNNLGNQFDSYSNIEGGRTTYGVDIDSYNISAYLTEGATSVSTTYTARQDGVLLSAEVIKVSNIPVADLGVTTSNPTGWLQGSTVTKKFTVSNNGPNDVPTQSVRFTTTLPSQLSFNGNQGDIDWQCSQAGQQLSCIYQPKLRSGWSDYLDLKLDVAGTSGQTANWSVAVDHDTAPYDIFDNHAENDNYALSVPINSTPAVDLSASSKTPNNLSGDILLAGDTLQYIITIDDASNLATSGIQLRDDLPANVTSYPDGKNFKIISKPNSAVVNSSNTGGANGTGYLDIQNISLAANGTAEIIFEVTVNQTAPRGASLQNQATISYNSNDWIVDTGDITVVEPDLSPSTIVISDSDGGLLEAGNTIDVIITLEEKDALDITNLQVTADVPAFISQFQVITTPDNATDNSLSVGGSNGSGYLDISNIAFVSGETPTVTLRLTIDPGTPAGTIINMSSLLDLGSKDWTITSDSLEVVDGTPASTGNKQLYLDTSTGLSRARPAVGTTDISAEGQRSWSLGPQLQSDLTFNLTDITVETKISGNRNRYTLATITFTLRDTDGVLLANKTLTNVSILRGRIDDVTTVLEKNNSLSDNYTVAAGKGLVLTIRNDGYNNQSNNNRRITLYTLASTDNSRKADGYSALIINASTVINIDNIAVWSAPFSDTNGDYSDDSGATLITKSQPDTTLSIRADVSDPFGAFDINQTDIRLQKSDGSFYNFSGNDLMVAIDDPSDDLASASKRFEKTFTLAETDELLGGWTISITSAEGVEGDVEHTNIKGFTVIPFLPSIALNKTIQVINDPISGPLSAGNKPKAIPGAELKYTIHAVNTGRGESDDNSITLQDEITTNSELYIGDITCLNRGPGTGAGPICFEDGANPNESQLVFNFLGLSAANDGIYFSQDGSDFNYEPVDSGDGYDPTVRYIRIKPSGTYKKAKKDGSETPEFNFNYQVRLQ
ncbi:hypothetical protein ACU6U9_21305 [Pseudomonas sp. HK3]